MSFSLVQMQPLEPFHVLEPEDPQVLLKYIILTHISAKIFVQIFESQPFSQSCPRQGTTVRLGSLLEFNAYSFHSFFINICQQVRSYLVNRELLFFLIIKPSALQASSASSVYLDCWYLLVALLPL